MAKKKKPTVRYSFRTRILPGPAQGLEAQHVGEELERIREDHGGHLEKQDIVDESVPPDALLHPCFTWDDALAARERRLDQAGEITRNLCCVVVSESGSEESRHPAYVSVVVDQEESQHPAYVPASMAMSDDEMRVAVLEQARADLRQFLARYRQLAALAGIVVAIEEFLG